LLALGLSRCALHIANCLAIQPGDRLELRDALVQAVDLCLRGHQRVSGQNVQPITRSAECGDKLANMGLEGVSGPCVGPCTARVDQRYTANLLI
jgi:hypothetical protein